MTSASQSIGSKQRKPTLAELRERYSGIAKEPSSRQPKPSLADLRQALEQKKAAAAEKARILSTAIEPEGEPVATNRAGDKRPDLNAIRSSIIACREASADTNNHEAISADYTRTRLQAEAQEWFSEVEWNVAMTLTFDDKRGVSRALAAELYGKFLPKLREIVVRKGSRRFVQNVPIIEDSKDQLREAGITMDGREGTHIHVLLRLRGDDPLKYKDAIAKAWKATNRKCGNPKVSCPNSNKWFISLTSQTREDLTGYFLKHQGKDTLGLLAQYLHLD